MSNLGFYVAQHRSYIYSAEYGEAWNEWKRTAGNWAPCVLFLGQAYLFAQLVGISRVVPVLVATALWIRHWIVYRPKRVHWWTAEFWSPCPPMCRAHGIPLFGRRLRKVQRHHLGYNAHDSVMKEGGDMSDPAARTEAARRESNWNAMAVCNFDHEAIEHLLIFLKWSTGRSKKSLRRLVSWGWVLFARTVPVLVLAGVWRYVLHVFS